MAFAASDSSKSSIKIAYPERNGMGKNADSHSLKCLLLEGFITPRKVPESSTQLSCLSNVTASLSLFQNECPHKDGDIGGYPIPQYRKKNRQIPKYRVRNRGNTDTAFVIGHVYLKLYPFRLFVYL